MVCILQVYLVNLCQFRVKKTSLMLLEWSTSLQKKETFDFGITSKKEIFQIKEPCQMAMKNNIFLRKLEDFLMRFVRFSRTFFFGFRSIFWSYLIYLVRLVKVKLSQMN